jgi:pimeloyl-ACP methyl ester carboxylesterase
MLNYWNRQDNPATFETLDEVRENCVAVTSRLSGNERFPQILNPKLEGFPKGTVYVYRSPDLYGGETGARNNTSFILFSDGRFDTKEAAKAYLEELGLIRLIDEAIGTILLIMPEKAEGYGENDLQSCYTLIGALFSQKAWVEVDGKRCVPAESEYCGGYGKTYMFGVGRGATFMNNFVAGSRDELIGRAAGYFTYGGEMSDAARVSQYVPAYLVDACGVAVQKFRRANRTNAYSCEDGVSRFYNQAVPLRQVYAAKDCGKGPGFWMEKAFRSVFMFLQRSANVMTKYLEPRVTGAYQGYVPAPAVTRFALSPRNPILNGRTAVGDLQVTLVHDRDRFSDVKSEANSLPFSSPGDYLDCWYEVLPQAVLDGTAPARSVPLLLANHGGGDDHLMFLDETGILLTAGEQGFAIVAPMHSGITVIAGQVLPRLVQYMLEKYPALDPERVWVTGYSMGGMATYNCINSCPGLFAAAAPMAMPLQQLPEGAEELFKQYDLPVMLITSTYDFAAWDAENNHLNEGGRLCLQTYSRFNGIAPAEDFDYTAYPVIGRPFDSLRITTINGEWRNGEWLIRNGAGVPMVGLNVTEYLQHSLWPGYGDILYNFVKHYRRDAGTGEIVYTA